MKVTALRNVCVGVDRHLSPGQVADVDEDSAKFLIEIGAVMEGEVTVELDTAPATDAASSIQ